MNCDAPLSGASASADGLPVAPGLGELSARDHQAVPLANEEAFICLRGPCRFYWERQEQFGGGPHRQRLRFCIFGPQTVELTDGNVLDCNRHEPPRLLRRLIRAIGL